MINKSAKNILKIDRIIQTIQSANLGVPILEKHFTSPYKTLVACIISLRTKDEVSEVSSKNLFQKADTPEKMIKLSDEEIAQLIYPCGFYRNKAKQIWEISDVLIKQYHGQVPSNREKLLKFRGVGLKTANLVLAQGFKIPAICVDIHVHRIMNRLGYVKTNSPDETENQLTQKLPKKYWLTVNSLLVNFGREICKPISPFCSSCKLNSVCPKTGVLKFR